MYCLVHFSSSISSGMFFTVCMFMTTGPVPSHTGATLPVSPFQPRFFHPRIRSDFSSIFLSAEVCVRMINTQTESCLPSSFQFSPLLKDCSDVPPILRTPVKCGGRVCGQIPSAEEFRYVIRKFLDLPWGGNPPVY